MSNFGYITITAADTPQPGLISAIYVGVSGDVVVKSTYDSTAVTFKAAPVGWLLLPHPVLFVMAATAATNLVGALVQSVRQTVSTDQ